METKVAMIFKGFYDRCLSCTGAAGYYNLSGIHPANFAICNQFKK
jgi:hypothetical protein